MKKITVAEYMAQPFRPAWYAQGDSLLRITGVSGYVIDGVVKAALWTEPPRQPARFVRNVDLKEFVYLESDDEDD